MPTPRLLVLHQVLNLVGDEAIHVRRVEMEL